MKLKKHNQEASKILNLVVENNDLQGFYGTSGGANITFVFNTNPSANKVFKTVNYEGDNGWQVDSFISEPTGYDQLIVTGKQMLCLLLHLFHKN